MRLVVSFTTTPSRIKMILPMAASVAYQTRKPDRFVLCLPPYCDKESTEYRLTEDTRSKLLEFGVEIFNCERDFGPATKLIPILKDETDNDTLIVTFDDDMLYEKRTLETLENASIKYPGAALGFVGAIKKQYVHGEELPRLNIKTIEVEELGGYRGVAYRRGLFDNSIFEDINAMLEGGLFLVDDQLISWNLKRRGIKRLVVRAEQGLVQNAINSAMLNLGVGIHMGANKNSREAAQASLKRLKDMYDKNGWRRP